MLIKRNGVTLLFVISGMIFLQIVLRLIIQDERESLREEALHVLMSENLKHIGFKLFIVLSKYAIILSKQPF